MARISDLPAAPEFPNDATVPVVIDGQTVRARASDFPAAQAVLEWHQPDYVLNTDSGYYRKDTGAFVASAAYGNIVFPLSADALPIRATATLGGSAMALALYFDTPDTSGNVLGFEVTGNNALHSQVVLSPPAGAGCVVICGQDSKPIVLEQQRYIALPAIAANAKAAYRAPTRTALVAAGAVPADSGDVAEVHGHTASGDSFARYQRGGQVYPTGTGWGLLASTASNAMAYGLATTYADADSTFLMADLDALRRKDANSFSEDYIELVGAGLTTLDHRAGGQIIYAETDAGQIREIDCAHIPLNKRITIAHRTETHDGQLVLDAGPGQEWSDFDSRFLVMPTGLRVQFQRVSTSQFVIVSTSSLNGNSLSGNDSHPATIRAASAFYSGQSLMDQGMGRGAAHGAFVNQLAAKGGPASTWLVDAAYGGSGICERDVANGDLNFWVDMTDPANPADGPNLTAAIAAIGTLGGDANQPAISFGLWDQGQQSSGYVDSPQAPNANFTKDHYKTATAYALARLRTAAGNANLPIGFQPIGRRSAVLSTNTGRMQVIREAQQELVAADANLFWLGETWDLVLRDTVHPDEWSYARAGERAADLVAKHVYAQAGIFDHPTITGAVFNAARNSIDITVTAGEAGTRFYKPADPIGFRVVNAAGAEVPIAKAWWSAIAGNTATLRLYLNGSAAGGSLYHVWDYSPGFDPTRAIRTRNSEGSKSLRPAKVAL